MSRAEKSSDWQLSEVQAASRDAVAAVLEGPREPIRSFADAFKLKKQDGKTMLGNIVYILCAAAALELGVFIGLALNNVLLVVDVRTGPAIDLSIWRNVPAVVGAGALLYGLIWEAE